MNERTNRTNGAAGDDPTPTGADAAEAAPARTRAEERIASLDTSGASPSQLIDQLTEQLEEATRKADAAEAGWQRARADFANFKRRTEEERAASASRASDALLLKVVALADDFDLAIEHVPPDVADSPWMEGISAIDRKLRQLLESVGVTPIEAGGQPFDPHEHQAISYEDSRDVPDGTVIKELQRGYTIDDRVLRPAFVAVARNDGSAPPGGASQDETTTPESD